MADDDDFKYFTGVSFEEHDFLKFVPDIARGLDWSVEIVGTNKINARKYKLNLSIIPDNRISTNLVEISYIYYDIFCEVKQDVNLEKLVKILSQPGDYHLSCSDFPEEIYDSDFNYEPLSITNALHFQEWYRKLLERVNITKKERHIIYPHKVQHTYDIEGGHCGHGEYHNILIVSAYEWTALIMDTETFGSCSDCDSYMGLKKDGESLKEYFRDRLSKIRFMKICRNIDKLRIEDIQSEFNRITEAIGRQDYSDFCD